MSNVLKFELPQAVRTIYSEPLDIFSALETIEFDIVQTMGPIGQMVKEHKHTVINWLDYSDFQKPFCDWKGTTKESMIKQKLSFNSRIASLGDIRATLIGGEEVILKKAEFQIRDITHEKQELARLMGIVTEVLFLEAVVYHPETMTLMSIEDYHIKSLEF